MTKMFRYDWSRFDAKMGLIFMVGALVVFNLMGRFDFAVYAAGISALLAWITIILVPRRRWSQHLLGLVVYLVIGTALTWLADILAPCDLNTIRLGNEKSPTRPNTVCRPCVPWKTFRFPVSTSKISST